MTFTANRSFHRLESPSQTPEVAKMQIDSREIWGGPARNFLQGQLPKVKAYENELPEDKRGIQFTTDVAPDRGCRPGLAYWSGPREGVRVEDGYAKIAVKITFCNQLDERGESG